MVPTHDCLGSYWVHAGVIQGSNAQTYFSCHIECLNRDCFCCLVLQQPAVIWLEITFKVGDH